jgi:transposase
MPRKYIKKNSYKKYSENSFQAAIKSIENGCSIRDASKTFSIPYTTLNLHINSPNINKQAGRPTKLNEEEEYNLEQAAVLLQVIIFDCLITINYFV